MPARRRNERQRLIRRQHMPVTNHPVTLPIAIFFQRQTPPLLLSNAMQAEPKRDEMRMADLS